MKDRLGVILSVIVLILAVVATTYSWFTWKLDEQNRIGLHFETNGPHSECITYSVNQSENKALIPVTKKENGYVTSIDINQNCDINLYADFKLKIDKLPPELKNKNFKYTFMEGIRLVSEDNFEEKKQGEIITIANNELIKNDMKNYKLYIWVDANNDNNINMQNKHYEFSLEASITDNEE